MNKPVYIVFTIVLIFLAASFHIVETPAAAKENEEAFGLKLAHQLVKDNKKWTTTDHSKTELLKQKFTSGEQVTQACISCHSEASTQFHKSIHWTWLASGDKKDMRYGKAGYSVNNYCISANAMEDKGCLSCHPSWDQKGVEGTVNCLVCHNDSGYNFTEAFTDIKAFSQEPDEETDEIIADLQQEVQQAVSKVILPSRKSCGDCHFVGGGGDGVKHGDLDTSLTKPNRQLDVHMGTDGKDFSCTRCHTTVNHNIAGRIYTNPAVEKQKSLLEDDLAPKITCVSCHSEMPHKKNSKMNDHTDIVACQSCHIPEFARVNPTKMWWDWSKSGKLKDGKPYVEEGPFGKPIYKSIKGEFRWEKNVVPEYFWFNGSLSSITADDVIDPGTIVKVNHPVGDRNDKNSRIFPFKIHRGKQPYDKINNKLVAPLLSTENGYWTTFDMNKAITLGNKAIGIPYSGQYDYVSTTSAFPITHMVAPKENALACNECHTRVSSRLSNITQIYLPGRDRSNMFDAIGWISVLGAFTGVLLHGLGRFFIRNGKEKN